MILHRTAYYEPKTGTIVTLVNNQLITAPIKFSDSYEEMQTKQTPTKVEIAYVEMLRQHLRSVLDRVIGFGRFTIQLHLVPNDPAFGPFRFQVVNEGGPSVDFSVASLAHQFNSDPVHFSNFRRFVHDQIENAGYRVS